LVAVLARAVQAAHSAGVVHRDLKPANVLMAPAVEGSANNVLGGFPKVSDFGLARLADEEAGPTGSGQVLGTPHYMAPEQALGRVKEIGPASDVWALGVILYRCLTRKLPFEADSVLETLDKVREEEPPRTFGSEVPRELQVLCLRCLEKEPGRRPSVASLAEALERVAAGGSDPWATTGPEARGRKEPASPITAPGKGETVELPAPATRSRRGTLIAAGVLILAVALGGWMLLKGFGKPSDRDRDVASGKTKDAGKNGKTEEEEGPFPSRDDRRKRSEQLEPSQFRVLHWAVDGEEADRRGVLGEESRHVRFGDQVKIEIGFDEPAYAYVIAYNPDGNEQLLWPTNELKLADESVRPQAVTRIECPARKGKFLTLNDASGLQVLALVASRKPLPPFEEWKANRGKTPWGKVKTSNLVWVYRGPEHGPQPWDRGVSIVPRGQRAEEADLKGAPPLDRLYLSLKKAGAELVELIAFGVQARKEER
jgi:hypothetical protein